MKPAHKAILFVVSSSLILTACFRSNAEPAMAAVEGVPVRTMKAAVQDVPLEIAAVGNVEAIQTVDVKPRIAGQIKRVAFEEGQMVTKGQLLFTVDLDTLQRQAAELQAEIERDVAVEQQARAVVERDAASQKRSQAEEENGARLAKEGILSKDSASQLVTANETAEAALRADQAAVDAAAGTLKADRARLAETQLQLSFTDVVAPISGRAGAIAARAGNIVRDGETTLVTIRQLSPLAIAFGIPEQMLADVKRLSAQGPLSVEAKAGDATLAGRLSFIDNVVDATTGTVRMKAQFQNADERLWPGQFVAIRLRLQTETGRLVAPESAVQDGQNGRYVWVVRSNVASIAPVSVARTYNPESGPQLAVLNNGLKPGDAVVTEGQIRLTPGVRVTVLGSDSPVLAR